MERNKKISNEAIKNSPKVINKTKDAIKERNKNSFSAITKSELLQTKDLHRKQRVAELGAFLNICGSLTLNKGVSLELDKPSFAKRVFSHIKILYDCTPTIHLKKFNKLGRNYKYIVKIAHKETVNKLLYDTHYLKEDGSMNFVFGINNVFFASNKSRQAYLRTVFVVCGSISDPNKNYHLEFVSTNENFAKDLKEKLYSLGLMAKLTYRKNLAVVYLKDAQNIVDFLTLIGASNSTLKFYDIKILKEVRNNVNRAVNCETANINKTVDAAARQLLSINKIKEKKGLNFLGEELKKVALLRLKNPDSSLNDLLEMCDFNISKSGLNHRLRRIDTIAQELD